MMIFALATLVKTELTETSKRHLVTIIRIIQIVLKIIIRIRKDLYQTIQSIDMISNNFVQ